MKLPKKNWNEQMDILKDHQKKEYHTTASLGADDFLHSVKRPEALITLIIDVKAARHIAENRKLLGSIISCIVFCGKQSIALRRHNESLSDKENNPGNFLALLKFRAEAGDDVLTVHLNKATNRAKYTSAPTQNELISIIGEQLRESIVGQIPENALFHSILADEVTNVVNKEQLSLRVCFVDIDGTIHKEFLRVWRALQARLSLLLFWTYYQRNLNIRIAEGRDMSSVHRST